MSFRKVAAPRLAGGSDCARRNRTRPLRSTREAVLEYLEDRTLLDGTAGLINKPTFVIYHPNGGNAPNQTSGPTGFSPAQVRKAYGLDSININGVVGNGSGQTIALVDAYDWPTAASDLAAFDKQFNLPAPPSFTKVNQLGQPSPLPTPDPQSPGGWEVEEALDVEWAHAAAPMANIILVEANSPANSDMLSTAVKTAADLPGVSVVSMSFGIDGGFAGETAFDSEFSTPVGHTGVTFMASTGDNGTPAGYPAESPNVVAVGGTSLFLNPDNSYNHETGWGNGAQSGTLGGGGGGTSLFEPLPPYQSAAGLTFPGRSTPDVSMIADPATGVSVYDSFDFLSASTPWDVIGGTSLASPMFSGLMAIVQQERAAFGDPLLDGASQTLPLLYSLPETDFHDITTGNDGLAAGPGYDQVTGRGSPIAPAIVKGMAPLSIQIVPFSPSSLSLAEEGNPLLDSTGNPNIQVAQFRDTSGNLPPADYIASIDWGDKSPITDGTITDLGDGFYGVYAGHTYAEEGTYTITIRVASPTGVVNSVTVPMTIVDAPLTPIPSTIAATEGAKFSGIVGSFTDANPTAPLSDYTVTINWGDSATSSGTVIQPAGPGTAFDVNGVHTYATFGTYSITINVQDEGGSFTQVFSTAIVADAPLFPLPKTITEVVGSAFKNVNIGAFVDSDPGGSIFDYSVSVDWGDGGPTSSLGNGVSLVFRGNQWNIMAGHVYQHYGNGSYPVTVTVDDIGGATTTVNSLINVVDASINASGTPFTVVEGATFNGAVAEFNSTNVFASPTDFNTPTINWGDGSALDVGSIVQIGPGTFGVFGTHVFNQVGTVPVTIGITSVGGSSATATAQATINDAPLLLTALAQTGVAGAPVGPVVAQPVSGAVATFVDTFSSQQLANLNATITWGDGTTSPGIISQPGGVGTTFYVTGQHAYETAQSAYAVTVTVNDAFGATATQSTTADVTDAPFHRGSRDAALDRRRGVR